MMMENNLAAPGSALIAGIRIPIVMDVGDTKLLAIPYTTDSLGAAYGFELSSTGMTRGIRWAEHRKDSSAQQYIGLGDTGSAAGIAFVAHHQMGYINVSRYSPGFGYLADKLGAETTTAVSPGSNWVRIAATPMIADWAMHIAYGQESGMSVNGVGTQMKTEATVFDIQAQGKFGEQETSLYATYAKAPADTYHNLGKPKDKSASTVGIDYSVVNHVLHVGAAVRNGTTGDGLSDNATLITGIYDMHQNVAFHLNYSMYSGEANSGIGAATNKLTFMLEAAW
jgi:hypothetical protein